MNHSDRISRFLPLTFKNGQTITRFAKHCVRCNELVGADHMHGIAALVQDRGVIAATARCPHCDTEFPVTCVITSDKRVHKVVLPVFILRWWLGTTIRSPRPRTESHHWQYEEASNIPPAAASIPSTEVVASPDILGSFDGKAIPAWLDVDGQIYDFSRTSQDGQHTKLTPQEILFEDSLVYRRRLPVDQA